MRLFEATGVGAFLLTDFKDNLHTLFAPGSRGRGLALDRRLPRSASTHYLGDDDGRAAIARAGQARTMAQHTYRHRAAEILGFVEQIAGAAMKLPAHRQADRQARRQGDADPAPPYPDLDRLSRARRHRRSARVPRIIGRMACGAHGDAAGARLSTA